MLRLSLSGWFLSILLAEFFFVSCRDNTGTGKSHAGIEQNTNPNGRYDMWGYIGPGGGGAMFNPAINPADPLNVFVSCDMTGSFVTYDGGKHWRMFNLRDVVEFYIFDRSDTNIVYAGTSNLLFKSTDKGKTWSTIYPRPSDIIAIHAQGDHANEAIITKDSIKVVVEKLAVDPDDSQKLFLLVRKRKIDIWPVTRGKNPRFYTEILISEDGGNNWKTIDKFRFDINHIFIDPTSPKENRSIYVSGRDGLGVKREGVWRDIMLPVGVGLPTQFVDGVDTIAGKHIIYAITGRSYFNPRGNRDHSGIYMTDDGGQTWKQLDGALSAFALKDAPAPELRSIAVSYYNPETIYISYANLRIAPDTVSFGVAKSEDFGQSWKLVWNDKALADVPKDPGISSPNRQQGWLDERFGPWWGENPFHMYVADQDPNICFATDFGRTIKTTDGGRTWEQVYTRRMAGGGWQSRGLQVTTGYMLAFDPYDPLHILMADTDTGLMESFDGGISWHSATKDNGVPSHWVNTTYWVVFDPDVKGKVWAVMSQNHDLPRPKMWRHMDMANYKGGVLVSENSGKTWRPVSEAIGEAAFTHIILETDSEPTARTLYVCAFGKGVYKSTDGGNTWELKNNGVYGNQPAAWRLTRKSDGELFLIVARKSEDGSIGNENDGALYRSKNGAEKWEKMKMPEGVNGPTSLVVDPDNPKHLLLSAWGRYGATEFSPDRGGGIFISEDDGITWTPVLTHDQHIHDITIDTLAGVYYAAGFNSSAYRSEDKGRTWQRIKGYNFKWGKRVQPDPYDRTKIYIITFGGGVWHGPAKGDDSAREDIITTITSFR